MASVHDDDDEVHVCLEKGHAYAVRLLLGAIAALVIIIIIISIASVCHFFYFNVSTVCIHVSSDMGREHSWLGGQGDEASQPRFSHC